MILENNQIEIRTSGADFEKIRTLLQKEDYQTACEQLQEMEQVYEADLWSAENKEFRMEFWQLVLESYTCNYRQYELDTESQKQVCRSLRNMKADGRIPICVVQYLHERIEYLRWEKILDFHAERRKMAAHVGLSGIGFLIGVWMLTISMPMISWMYVMVGNLIISVLVVGYLILIAAETYFCLCKYQKLRDFLYHPVPFEQGLER